MTTVFLITIAAFLVGGIALTMWGGRKIRVAEDSSSPSSSEASSV